jgi:hypothetical protein
MYYSYVEIEYVAMSFSPARTDLALKLLTNDLILAAGATHLFGKKISQFKSRIKMRWGGPVQISKLL